MLAYFKVVFDGVVYVLMTSGARNLTQSGALDGGP